LQHSNESRTFKVQVFYIISKANHYNFGQEPSLNGAAVISAEKSEGYHAATNDDREMKNNYNRFLCNNVLFIPSLKTSDN
jgi:hypothetical protein